MIGEGDVLPAAELTTPDGAKADIADYRGKPMVLFFYPKASTPGCTAKSVEFSEKLPEFEKLGISVVGASADTPKRQSNFIAKNDLHVDILSDESTEWLEKLGVWAEKKNYGRTYMGIVRTTLLVDGDGKVVKIWSPCASRVTLTRCSKKRALASDEARHWLS